MFQALEGLNGVLDSITHIVKRDIHDNPSSYMVVRLKCEEYLTAEEV